jgi:hypothetical protein
MDKGLDALLHVNQKTALRFYPDDLHSVQRGADGVCPVNTRGIPVTISCTDGFLLQGDYVGGKREGKSWRGCARNLIQYSCFDLLPSLKVVDRVAWWKVILIYSAFKVP